MKKEAISLISTAFQTQAKQLPIAAKKLEGEFRQLRTNKKFEQKQLASRFIVSWLFSYRQFQTDLNAQFNRKVRHTSADEFTAAIAFTLEQYLRSQGLKGWVHSEIGLPDVQRLRFDIVVKSPKTDLPVAVIECKTQLGWNRSGWHKEQKNRGRTIRRKYPDTVIALCVHRRSNWKESWPIFDKAAEAGSQWVCLMEDDPTEQAQCESFRRDEIETLFRLIKDMCIKLAKRE